jgi:ElaB/YqjD/DUF883 family membrane-anchored ribosome-binding protein
MSRKMVNLDFLDREAQLYRTASNEIKDTSNLVQKTIDEHTKTEVADVENAIKKLNGKIEKIMQTDFIKTQKTTMEKAREQINKSMETARDTFFKVKKVIDNHQTLTPDKKSEMEKKLYNKIIDKFLTKEEKDLFNRMMTNNGIVILGGESNRLMLT